MRAYADSVEDKTPCDCPKPCTQVIYEPSLSQAALSYLSVDNILNNEKQLDEITTSFHDALEVTLLATIVLSDQSHLLKNYYSMYWQSNGSEI